MWLSKGSGAMQRSNKITLGADAESELSRVGVSRKLEKHIEQVTFGVHDCLILQNAVNPDRDTSVRQFVIYVDV